VSSVGDQRVDLDKLERNAIKARQGTTGEWAWDDGDLIELDHETAVGIQVTQAAGTPAAPHISTVDPATVLAWVAESRRAREVVEVARGHRELMVLHGEHEALLHSAGCALCRALTRYDQHDPSPTHDQAGS
jgi:hypothetical protein